MTPSMKIVAALVGLAGAYLASAASNEDKSWCEGQGVCEEASGLSICECFPQIPKPFDYLPTFRIGIAQMTPTYGDVQANLQAMKPFIAHASAKNTSLLIFPELTTTGYTFFPKDQVDKFVEPMNGPSYQTVQEMSTFYNVSVVYSFMELGDDGKYYDTAALVHPSGLLGSHRKTTLSGDWEVSTFTQGTELKVFDVDGVRVGLMICAEISYPEVARSLAMQRAQLLAIPTGMAAPPEGNYYSNITIPQRANENLLYAAYSNWYAPATLPGGFAPFQGLSRIAQANFISLNFGDPYKEQLLLADILPTVWETYFCDSIMGQRQPETYGDLTDPTLQKNVCNIDAQVGKREPASASSRLFPELQYGFK